MASLVLAVGFTAPVALADNAAATPKHCVVNGDDFAEHRNHPIEVTHNNESIKVCCKKCARKFKKDPEKYIEKYKKALKDEAAATTAGPKTASLSSAKEAASCCAAH